MLGAGDRWGNFQVNISLFAHFRHPPSSSSHYHSTNSCPRKNGLHVKITDNQKGSEWDLCKGTGKKQQIIVKEYIAEQIHCKSEENMNKLFHVIKKKLENISSLK